MATFGWLVFQFTLLPYLPCEKSPVSYALGMTFILLLFGCMSSEEAQLRTENARLENELASLRLELEGLRNTSKNVQMLERASQAAVTPIGGRCQYDNGVYRFTKDLLAEMQASPESVVREGRWVPTSPPGSGGWRVVHIGRQSLLASCGIRNNDVLLTVNGGNVPAEWKLVLENAATARDVEVVLRRGKKEVELTYRKQ